LEGESTIEGKGTRGSGSVARLGDCVLDAVNEAIIVGVVVDGTTIGDHLKIPRRERA